MRIRNAIDTGLCGLLLLGWAPAALAFVANITNSTPPSIYLRVGDGVYTGGTFTSNPQGTPGNGGPINLVSVTVPAVQVGNGTSQVMATNALQGNSNYDNYPFCNVPAQLYIGGFNRQSNSSGGNGTVTVTTPANLTSGAGNTIPFTQISWTSSANDGSGADAFPAGAFTGGMQTLATFPVNTWRENCFTFSYANSAVKPVGTYTGRATYTLSVP